MRLSLLGLSSVAVALTILPASAEEADIQACAAISNNLDRLSCYDKASGRSPSVNIAKADGSAWRVRSETSKLTDMTNVFIQNDSKEDIYCGRYSNSPATIIVRCMDNVTSFYVSTDCHLASSDYSNYGEVTYRLDDEPADKIDMDASTSNEALGLWRGDRAIPFIKRMLEADRLLLQFTPYGQNSVLAEYDISGLNEVIKPLRDACNW
ncbi:type VI secretion system-associated protein TagO [Martelella sp. AMO21009]